MAAEQGPFELEMKVEWTKAGILDYFAKMIETQQPKNGDLGSDNWV